MVHFLHDMVPLRFCYQIYSLLVVCCFCSGITLLGMAFVALYGMGGKELCMTISVITLYSVLRLCIPPWDETLKSLCSRSREKKKILAVDKFTLGQTDPMTTTTCCSICLHDFVEGNELSKGRVCGHVFHQECLDMWLPKNTSCPYCRHDLEERDPDYTGGDIQKPVSMRQLFGGAMNPFYS